MPDAFHVSQTVVNIAAAAIALVMTVLLFVALRRMIRLGRKPGERIFSDLPALVHGPQELPDQRVRAFDVERGQSAEKSQFEQPAS